MGGDVMIDIHTHVLPGIDDGSRDLRTSMRMLMMAYKYGTRRVIATPIFGEIATQRLRIRSTD